MTPTPFVIMATVLFGLGIYTVCTRNNAVAYLMGIELILNSASINFITFAHFNGNRIDGQIFALFIIALAACESVIGLAIILGMYRNYKSIDTTNTASLKY
jgi:NADH:ubiquinone oxidoreductase subunit K